MNYDPGYQQAAERTFVRLGFPPNRPQPRFPRGDVESRRQGEAFLTAVFALDPKDHPEIEKTIYEVPGYEEAEISLYAYRKHAPQPTSPRPAVLYMHGGGMILGSVGLFEPLIKDTVAATEVAHFAVGYRYAPEFPHPTPVEDCYAALVWMSTHAHELNIDAARIGVAGLSAGGGLAAAVTLMARDRGLHPPIKKQILFCPMLDDCNTVTDHDLLPLMTWSWDDNWTGWNALLEGKAGSASVSQYASPARAEDLRGLPSTFIDVGSLDIFADESKAYVELLKVGNVEVEFRLYKGVPHGFEFRGLGSSILQKAESERHSAIRSL